MKTANEKASEIVGHGDPCHWAIWPVGNEPCTCSHSPEVQVAAVRGRLRREHDVAHDSAGELYCRNSCGPIEDGQRRGPCFLPIDDGEKWRLLRELVGAAAVSNFAAILLMINEDIIAEEFVAAHDAGLLKK